MSTEDKNTAPRFSPLSVAESYSERKAAAWKEYMNTITGPWLECQQSIKAAAHNIALDPKHNTPKEMRVIIAAMDDYSREASGAFENYVTELMRAYYLDCLKDAGLDPLRVATLANQGKKEKQARKERCKPGRKLGAPKPKQVKPGVKGLPGEKGKT